jgi:ankyrin repeat protein
VLSRFRWVFCQLEALKRCLKASLIRQALRNLPRTLDETYTRLFLDIDPNYQQDAKYALAWLAFSGRPLQLAELAEAIAIDPTSNRPFDPEERFPDPESVFHILSSLITVSSDENWDQAFDSPDTFGSAVTVQLAHFSVKEYLVSDRILESPARYFAASTSVAQRFISECCLIYILQYVFTPLTKDSTQFVTFPLLDYASAYWYMHLSLVAPEQQQSLNPLAIRLLLDNSALRSWLQIHTPLQTSIMGVGRLEEVESPLVYASDMGLFSVTRQLLADGCDPNESCRDPPLHLAARRGHENVVALLLDYGAKINVKNIEGHTPLHSAVQYEGNISVVQILLNHGADVNTANNHGSTPLFSAVYGDHGDIARLLVERGARVEDSDNEMHQTPLHRAAWNEDGPLLDFLLKHGANINAKNIRGETALHYAAKYGQNTLSQLLVNGADPNIQADNGETPLYWAVNNGQKQAVELLVNAGARIDFQVLSLAEEAFHSVFHLLLSACSASAESAAAIQMVFEGSKLRGYWLCQECPFMLSNRPERAGDVVLPFRTSDERGTIPQAEVIWVGLAKM